MKILLVEPNHAGHRLNNAGLILEALNRLPSAQVIFGTGHLAPESPQYKTWIAPRLTSPGSSLYDQLSSPANARKPSFGRMFKQVIAAVRATGADHVLVPTGDGLMQIAAVQKWFPGRHVPSGTEMETMLLRGRFAYDVNPSLRDRLVSRIFLSSLRRSPFTRIHHMDPIVYRAVKKRMPDLGPKFVQIPDPVDPIEPELSTTEARRKLQLPEGGRMLGCVGALDGRKGVPILIQAFATAVAAGRLREDDRLLLVGEQDPEVVDALERMGSELIKSGRIISIARFVSDVDMSNAISAMNLVVTPYPLHIGSASIVIRAAAQRRPVLATDFGWLGEIVTRFQLGWVCDVLNPAGFADALVAALDASERFEHTRAAEQFVSFCAVKNYQAHWMQRIAQRLGITPPGILRWEQISAA